MSKDNDSVIIKVQPISTPVIVLHVDAPVFVGCMLMPVTGWRYAS
jgi:hypothetical protein